MNEVSKREGMYGVTDELRYELVAVEVDLVEQKPETQPNQKRSKPIHCAKP